MSTTTFEIKRILIPYDFSETAKLSLEHAVFMAKLLKADIYLLHILESVSFTSAFIAYNVIFYMYDRGGDYFMDSYEVDKYTSVRTDMIERLDKDSDGITCESLRK